MDRATRRARVRGLYAIADADASGGDPIGLLADLLAGGCRLVQLRCKGWPADDVRRAAADAVARCAAAGAMLIVNDHADVAAAVGADGVHLGQLDVASDHARALLGPDRLIGRSTNDPAQIRAALAGADYVAFGPVWETPNAGRPKVVRGPTWLRAARELVPRAVPLVAIGGITPERIAAVRDAGADAWAVIGAIAAADDRVAATRAMRGT